MMRIRVRVLATAAVIGCTGGSSSSPGGIETEDVSFRSGALRLSGTLHRPSARTQVPGVVLIHGSGATDRSTMRWIGSVFARHGIAALAYDKRGVGASDGPEFAWRDYSFHDLAADAAAGLAYLGTRPDINANCLGLFGASQGGWVVPLAARQSGAARFVVLVSASVTTVGQDNLFERSARLRAEGFTPDEVAEAEEMHRVDQRVSRSGDGFDEFTRLWSEHRNKRWFRRVYLGAEPMAPTHPYRLWYRTVVDFDPVPVLRELALPTFWLFGDPELDRFGPVRQSVEALERLRGEGKDYFITVFPGADHSLQRPGGGEAPYAERLSQWLHEKLPTACPERR